MRNGYRGVYRLHKRSGNRVPQRDNQLANVLLPAANTTFAANHASKPLRAGMPVASGPPLPRGVHQHTSLTECGRGGTGRRATLRSLWPKGRGSSSLLDRTKQSISPIILPYGSSAAAKHGVILSRLRAHASIGLQPETSLA